MREKQEKKSKADTIHQANHFHRYAPEKIPYGIQRYQNETRRLYRVLETRLQEQADQHRSAKAAYLVGGKFTIADLACFSWVNWAEWAGIRVTADEFPQLTRWMDEITARPAVGRGLDVSIFVAKRCACGSEMSPLTAVQ